jgi:pyruvate-ferredoxin/flavodoxin oxidoreductase
MLDSRTPTRKVKEFLQQQTRFQMLTKSKPDDAKKLWELAQHDVDVRYGLYEYLAHRKTAEAAKPEAPQAKPSPVATTNK